MTDHPIQAMTIRAMTMATAVAKYATLEAITQEACEATVATAHPPQCEATEATAVPTATCAVPHAHPQEEPQSLESAMTTPQAAQYAGEGDDMLFLSSSCNLQHDIYIDSSP